MKLASAFRLFRLARSLPRRLPCKQRQGKPKMATVVGFQTADRCWNEVSPQAGQVPASALALQTTHGRIHFFQLQVRASMLGAYGLANPMPRRVPHRREARCRHWMDQECSSRQRPCGPTGKPTAGLANARANAQDSTPLPPAPPQPPDPAAPPAVPPACRARTADRCGLRACSKREQYCPPPWQGCCGGMGGTRHAASTTRNCQHTSAWITHSATRSSSLFSRACPSSFSSRAFSRAARQGGKEQRKTSVRDVGQQGCVCRAKDQGQRRASGALAVESQPLGTHHRLSDAWQSPQIYSAAQFWNHVHSQQQSLSPPEKQQAHQRCEAPGP